jgi:hypothetical protein
MPKIKKLKAKALSKTGLFNNLIEICGVKKHF